MQFAAKWMDLEGIKVKYVRQRKTNTVCYHLYVESKKYNKLENKTRSRLIENKPVVTTGERERGRGKIGVGKKKKGLLWDYMKSCV